MKKLALSLIASLAFAQSAYAALAPLNESLAEVNAITAAIATDTDFDSSEFVVEIKRLSRSVNSTGTFRYLIVTKDAAVVVEPEDSSSSSSSHHHHHDRYHRYLAIIEVTPNGIGPNLITVTSITPIHHHH